MRNPATFDLSVFAHSGLSLSVLSELLDYHERITLPRCQLLWRYYRNPMQVSASTTPARGSGSALVRWRPPHSSSGAGRYRLAQEQGLPARLLGAAGSRSGFASASNSGWTLRDDRDTHWRRKEIVIENDVAWRVHTMIDFMFGRPVVIASLATDPQRQRLIERTLDAVWESSGGVGLLQDMALLAHVYGHVDLLVRSSTLQPNTEPNTAAMDTATNTSIKAAQSADTTSTSASTLADHSAVALAQGAVRIEAVDPSRGLALIDSSDYRHLNAYILRWCKRAEPAGNNANSQPNTHASTPGFGPSAPSILRRIIDRWSSTNVDSSDLDAASTRSDAPSIVVVTEILDAQSRRVFEQRVLDRGVLDTPVLVDQSPALGASDRDPTLGPPVVHIQNLSQPLAHEGLSEVEPLIPLQDELNTRLSDRASRVTLQSFKMLLAKGLGDVQGMTVAPGVVWKTDNPDAKIEAFGGDANSPSEERHIDEIREALDKLSGVPPLAGGVVRAKIGNLSSANALRVTLLGLLSKTARKRITYGRGIAEASRLVLEALDTLGVLKTEPSERAVRVEWPDPLPRDERELLEAAMTKIALGVDRERVLSELGYGRGEGVE